MGDVAIVLVVRVVIGVLIVGAPIWLAVRVHRAQQRADESSRRAVELGQRLSALEAELTRLKERVAPVAPTDQAPAQTPPKPSPESLPLLSGLALFLGVGFFLKYSFDHDWISPPIRVAMGLLVGLGLLVGGLRLSREEYAVTLQTLCGAGLLVLYADVFAAIGLYRLIPAGVAYALMILVTVTAFSLAVRLAAPAVAGLGLGGGFLTPPLLSTGQDQPVAGRFIWPGSPLSPALTIC